MFKHKSHTPDYAHVESRDSNAHSPAKSGEELRLSTGLRQRETLMQSLSHSIAVFNVEKFSRQFTLLPEPVKPHKSVSCHHRDANNRHAGHIKLMTMLQNL